MDGRKYLGRHEVEGIGGDMREEFDGSGYKTEHPHFLARPAVASIENGTKGERDDIQQHQGKIV